MEYLNLEDVCLLNMGQSPDSSTYNEIGEGLPFYQGNADFGEKYPRCRVWCTNPTRIAEKEDILISVRAPIGALNEANEKCCIGRGLASIRPQGQITKDYLFYFLLSKKEYLISKGTGTTFKAISKNILKRLSIPILSLSEQGKQAGSLNHLWDIIQKRRFQLAKLDELVKCRFVEMFGDPIIFEKCKHLPQLGEICCLRAGQFVKANDIQTERSEGLYPCFGGNGRRGYVSDYTHDGDYPVIGRQGALCGNVQFVRGKFHATEHAVVVTPRIKMDRCWLYHLLKILNLNRYAIGAAQPGLAVCKLEKIHIQMSDLNEQSQFSHFYRQCDKLRFVSCFSSDKRPRVWALVSLSRPLRKAYTLPYLKEEGMMMEC